MDYLELVAIAREANLHAENNSLKMSYGMALFRCGEFPQALKWLPETSEPSSPVSFAFRAMAERRLGNLAKARESLERAQEERQKHLPTPEGHELSWYFRGRPVAWCENEIAIQQAELDLESATQ